MEYSTQSWSASIAAALLFHVLIVVAITYQLNDDEINKDELLEYSIDLTSFQAPPAKIEKLKPVKTVPPVKKVTKPVPKEKKKPVIKKKLVKKKIIPKKITSQEVIPKEVINEPQIAPQEFDADSISEETQIQKPAVASKPNASSYEGNTTSQAANVRDEDKAKYYKIILSKLKRLQKYPPMARRRQEQGVAKLTFVLKKDGSMQSYRITKSSGFKLLDREVEALIKRAAPFPPIPKSFGNGKLELTVPIAFVLK